MLLRFQFQTVEFVLSLKFYIFILRIDRDVSIAVVGILDKNCLEANIAQANNLSVRKYLMVNKNVNTE